MHWGKRAEDYDPTIIYYRSDRVSLINGLFYFSTREGTMEGPFNTRLEACKAVDSYIRSMTGEDPSSPGGSFSLSDH